MNEKILVVDDEKEIADLLDVYLKNDGYTVYKFYNGTDALACLKKTLPDLAILDVMLPDIDGFHICQKIRESYYFPVIMLTAKIADTDKIMGLTIGADDYITKPFNPVELCARVRSHLRRYIQLGGAAAQNGAVMRVGGIELNDESKAVTLDGEPVSLTPLEYSILRLLMETPGKVFSSDEIYQAVWNDAPYGANATVAVHIRHLREKLEIDPANPRYIKVVWGLGYKMEKV